VSNEEAAPGKEPVSLFARAKGQAKKREARKANVQADGKQPDGTEWLKKYSASEMRELRKLVR